MLSLLHREGFGHRLGLVHARATVWNDEVIRSYRSLMRGVLSRGSL